MEIMEFKLIFNLLVIAHPVHNGIMSLIIIQIVSCTVVSISSYLM